MNEEKELDGIQEGDVYVTSDVAAMKEVKGAQSDTGYPFNLDEEKIVRLIYFFGARKLGAKAARKGTETSKFTSTELLAIKQFFQWFGLVPGTVPREVSKAYQSVVIKFKTILGFLKIRPAFVTKDIYTALNTAGYQNITRNIIYVVNETGQITPRLLSNEDQKTPIPLAQMDSMLWDMQNTTLDKMMLIVQSITPADIKKANLGMKSKAMRDLFAMYHMSKLNNKNPNLSLININVNATEQKNKLGIYQTYINKNREL